MNLTGYFRDADIPRRHELRGLLRTAIKARDQDVFRRWHRGIAYWGLIDNGYSPEIARAIAMSDEVNDVRLEVEEV